MFARTFSLTLGRQAPSLWQGGSSSYFTRPSQSDAWNRSALSEDTVRDRKLRQLHLASSSIQGLRPGRGQCLLCMPYCRVATWRSSVVFGNAGGDHTGAHIKACISKSLFWCFLAVFTTVCQPSLVIIPVPPNSAGSRVSLLSTLKERVGKYQRVGDVCPKTLLIVNSSVRPSRAPGRTIRCVTAT